MTVDQINYTQSIGLVPINNQRRKERLSVLTETERESYRKAIGQLNWVATHTRPDIAYDVCELSVSMKSSTVENLLHLNKLIRRAKTDNFRLCFPSLYPMRDCKLECYSDAAFANLPDEGSQGGYVIFLRSYKRCPIAWQSKKIKRVVKSALAAETMACLECAEAAVYIAEIMAEVTGMPKMKISVFVDSKSLIDNLQT